MVTIGNAVHLTLGNPRTVCGRRIEECNKVTSQYKEVSCGHCKRQAPREMRESAQVLPESADKALSPEEIP